MNYSFKNDYSEGAHPRILEALISANLKQSEGYGNDAFSLEAAELLRQKCAAPDAAVHFFSGGTQTNLTAISAFLRPHEAAIAVETGHILVHETGAIEATGHKVILTAGKDGKLEVGKLREVVAAHSDEHMVKPKLVYISNSTETGSLYKKNELEELSDFCRANGLWIYLDGARLGSALASGANDLSLPEVAALVDAFYIGGTKNGALLGEALLIMNDRLKDDFRFHLKQKGALLAKGRLLGIQFLELFRDGLYFELARHANEMAKLMQDGIRQAGYELLLESETNQIFPILPDKLIAKLQERYDFYVWQKIAAEKSAIRLVTSWATPEEAVAAFIEELKN